MRSARLVLRRGALEEQTASALVTSANDALVGNDQPEYWRFSARPMNADGALRRAAGPSLAAACLTIEPVVEAADDRDPRSPPSACGRVRRDLVRWTAAVKRGASAAVRCPTGGAVATAASGRLRADSVVHAVAPDFEMVMGRYAGRRTDPRRERAYSGDAARCPEELLRDAYVAAFARAAERGARDVACAALGCGVKGWHPAVAAAFGIEARGRDGVSHKDLVS